MLPYGSSQESGNISTGLLIHFVEKGFLGVEKLTLDDKVCCGNFLAYDMGYLFY